MTSEELQAIRNRLEVGAPTRADGLSLLVEVERLRVVVNRLGRAAAEHQDTVNTILDALHHPALRR